MPIERAFETLIFRSRWILAPFYFGLVVALLMLMVKFCQELIHLVPQVFSMTENETILMVLSLIDMSLAGNLLLMVIFAGYENFVSKIDTGDHEDRPDWMGKVDFAGLKLKLIASIVAISGIHLLKAFMNVGTLDKGDLGWMIGIHMTFVVSGVLLALMDRIVDPPGSH
ncbi:MAG: hypothetical protein RLZZ501_1015 [Pseudomonadota bacterium]|jgi:uncharacterized protein (TIGR00645 family)